MKRFTKQTTHQTPLFRRKGAWVTYNTTKLVTLLLLCIFSSYSLYAQSPAQGTRWNAGDGWRYNSSTGKWTIITSNAQNLPLGIVRCASSAETQSGLTAFARPYRGTTASFNGTQSQQNSDAFPIGKLVGSTRSLPENNTPCFNQQTEQRNASVNVPTNNEQIVWFNFDIRQLAGTYQFQIVTNQSVGWALYYIDPNTSLPADGQNTSTGTYPQNFNASNNINNLSGTFGQNFINLKYADCGLSGNGWSTITVPSFTKPTNYYLAMWMNGTTATAFPSSTNLVYKSRFGCGGSTCTLEKVGDPALTCVSGGYQVCQNFVGSAGRWKINDEATVKATSYTVTTFDQNNAIVEGPTTYTAAQRDNIFLELGTISGSGIQRDVKATICATYASGNSYNITLTPSGTPSDAPSGYVACTSGSSFSGNGLNNTTVNPGQYGPLCINDAAITLGGSPSGGTWTGPGVSGSVADGFTFNPATAGAGTKVLTYSVAASSTQCANSNTTSVVVNERPAAPTLSKVDPTCAVATGSITVTAPLDGGSNDYEYSITGGDTWQDAVTFSGLTANQTYNVIVRLKSSQCISPATAITLPAQPVTPNAPNVTITEATLCGPLTGPKLTVNSPIVGLYTLSQTGETDRTFNYDGNNGPVEFANLKAGKGFSITVLNADGCTSAERNCTNLPVEPPVTQTTIQQNSRIKTEIVKLGESQTKVQAAPNPFREKVRFQLESAVSGYGSLEIFNAQGQRVGVAFQGYVEKGRTQTIEYTAPAQQQGALIYQFRVGDQRVSGKLLNLK